MYTLADVYKTFPSGCTEEYKILRAFEMGKQISDKEIDSLSKHILDLQKDKGNLTDRVRELEQQIEKMKNWCNCKNYSQCLIELAEQGKGMKPSECCVNCKKWELEDYKTRLERRNKKKQEIKEK